MTERQDFDKPTRAEDEYFHRRDRELLEQARRAERVAQDAKDLASALRLEDGDLVRRLQALNLNAATASLIAWLPAIQLGWLKGLTGDEKAYLLGRVRQEQDQLDPEATGQLESWLTTKPDDALFAAAREALKAQLAAAPAAERDALRAKVLDAARGISAASGGVLGIGSVSADERAALEALARDLETPA